MGAVRGHMRSRTTAVHGLVRVLETRSEVCEMSERRGPRSAALPQQPLGTALALDLGITESLHYFCFLPLPHWANPEEL